jgi:dual specificity phosphatase 12
MTWMESFLEGGQLAGKIICPNQNCGTKLGSYDWAEVRCGVKNGLLWYEDISR